MTDKYAPIRSYLDLVLQPWTRISGNNGSHHELTRVYRRLGMQEVDALLAAYFEEMGGDGQKDTYNKWVVRRDNPCDDWSQHFVAA